MSADRQAGCMHARACLPGCSASAPVPCSAWTCCSVLHRPVLGVARTCAQCFMVDCPPLHRFVPLAHHPHLEPPYEALTTCTPTCTQPGVEHAPNISSQLADFMDAACAGSQGGPAFPALCAGQACSAPALPIPFGLPGCCVQSASSLAPTYTSAQGVAVQKRRAIDRKSKNIAG